LLQALAAAHSRKHATLAERTRAEQQRLNNSAAAAAAQLRALEERRAAHEQQLAAHAEQHKNHVLYAAAARRSNASLFARSAAHAGGLAAHGTRHEHHALHTKLLKAANASLHERSAAHAATLETHNKRHAEHTELAALLGKANATLHTHAARREAAHAEQHERHGTRAEDLRQKLRLFEQAQAEAQAQRSAERQVAADKAAADLAAADKAAAEAAADRAAAEMAWAAAFERRLADHSAEHERWQELRIKGHKDFQQQLRRFSKRLTTTEANAAANVTAADARLAAQAEKLSAAAHANLTQLAAAASDAVQKRAAAAEGRLLALEANATALAEAAAANASALGSQLRGANALLWAALSRRAAEAREHSSLLFAHAARHQAHEQHAAQMVKATKDTAALLDQQEATAAEQRQRHSAQLSAQAARQETHEQRSAQVLKASRDAQRSLAAGAARLGALEQLSGHTVAELAELIAASDDRNGQQDARLLTVEANATALRSSVSALAEASATKAQLDSAQAAASLAIDVLGAETRANFTSVDAHGNTAADRLVASLTALRAQLQAQEREVAASMELMSTLAADSRRNNTIATRHNFALVAKLRNDVETSVSGSIRSNQKLMETNRMEIAISSEKLAGRIGALDGKAAAAVLALGAETRANLTAAAEQVTKKEKISDGRFEAATQKLDKHAELLGAGSSERVALRKSGIDGQRRLSQLDSSLGALEGRHAATATGLLRLIGAAELMDAQTAALRAATQRTMSALTAATRANLSLAAEAHGDALAALGAATSANLTRLTLTTAIKFAAVDAFATTSQKRAEQRLSAARDNLAARAAELGAELANVNAAHDAHAALSGGRQRQHFVLIKKLRADMKGSVEINADAITALNRQRDEDTEHRQRIEHTLSLREQVLDVEDFKEQRDLALKNEQRCETLEQRLERVREGQASDRTRYGDEFFELEANATALAAEVARRDGVLREAAVGANASLWAALAEHGERHAAHDEQHAQHATNAAQYHAVAAEAITKTHSAVKSAADTRALLTTTEGALRTLVAGVASQVVAAVRYVDLGLLEAGARTNTSLDELAADAASATELLRRHDLEHDLRASELGLALGVQAKAQAALQARTTLVLLLLLVLLLVLTSLFFPRCRARRRASSSASSASPCSPRGGTTPTTRASQRAARSARRTRGSGGRSTRRCARLRQGTTAATRPGTRSTRRRPPATARRSPSSCARWSFGRPRRMRR